MQVRLDKLVSDRFALSRRVAQEAVRNGKIDLAGTRCDEPGRMVAPDSDLAYFPSRPKQRKVVGAGVAVLHEDADVLIVNKPAGLLTLPTAAHEPDTLSTRVENYLRLRHGTPHEVGIIHRLDKDTSGAIAFAKGIRALPAFQELMRAHAVERQYLAVVEGYVGALSGTIEKAIVLGRDQARHRVSAHAGEGMRAVTHFRVVERIGRVATLVACWLETGRTHQIRLHLADAGHPVVGDLRYRNRSSPASKARFHRQALHAQTLGFTHPITGAQVHVEAPLPPDMTALINDLRMRFGIRNAGG